MTVILGVMGYRNAYVYADSKQFQDATFNAAGVMTAPAIPLAATIKKTFKCSDIELIGVVCDLLHLNNQNSVMSHARTHFNTNPNNCLNLNDLVLDYTTILSAAIGASGLQNSSKNCRLCIIGHENITQGQLQMFQISVTCNNGVMNPTHQLISIALTHVQYHFDFHANGDISATNAAINSLRKRILPNYRETEANFFVRRASTAIKVAIRNCGQHPHCAHPTCGIPISAESLR